MTNGQGWGNPDFGGTALRLAAMRSPNFVAGSTGWTINQDGSVEFNNGTFRGTVTAGSFVGTDFIINPSGAFFYSGTPASGNLIESIAPAAGTDSFGNHYVAGYGSYDNTNVTFAQLLGAKFGIGQIQAGVPDTTDAGGLSALAGILGEVLLSSGLAPPNGVNAAQEELLAGQNSQTTGSGNCPTIVTGGSTAPGATASDVDWLHTGSIIHVDRVTGLQDVWQAPVAAANWTVGTLQYRRTIEDEIWFVGSISYTGANVAAAGASAATAAQTIHPIAQWKDSCAHLTSTSVQKNTAASVIFNTNGSLTIQWGDGVAGSAHDVNGLATGDIFWIDSRIPQGHIP